MPLYHATFAELALGIPVTPLGPTQVYPKAVTKLEAGKPVGCPSRSLCVFATDNLAGATKFAQKQYPGKKGLRVYTVEMAVFHKAPMRIVHTLESRLANGQPVERLVNEYWNPSLPWRFYEYFGPSFVPTAEVAPANAGEVMVFDSSYFVDGDHVRHLCEAA
jgi:hypothetical protein